MNDPICLDEGPATFLHVNGRDAAHNRVSPDGQPQARNMRLGGGNKILTGRHHSHAEFEVATGKIRQEFSRWPY